MRKEYEEFIFLLKEYLKVKPSKMRVINIVATKYGRYEYYSENGAKITLGLKRKHLENSEEYCSEEDILTGILISVNPGKIIIHNKRNMQREILSTITKIFENSCVFCGGCSICKTKVMQ
jgi:putative sporulation protein YtxC